MFGVVAMIMGIEDHVRTGVRTSQNRMRGYTVVELMVTIVIVSVLAATVGMFFVKLLTIQEREREEAYIRERLSDICGAYADFVSVGASFHVNTNSANTLTAVKYRQETGGVSLETGLVTKATCLTTMMNPTNRTLDLDIYSESIEGLNRRFSRRMNGDASLIPLLGDMVSCTITPLNHTKTEVGTNGYETTDAALGWLQVAAKYRVENGNGEMETKTATAGRVVRLWNRE